MFIQKNTQKTVSKFLLISLLVSSTAGSLHAGGDKEALMPMLEKFYQAAMLTLAYKQIKMLMPKAPEFAEPDKIKESLADVKGAIPQEVYQLIRMLRDRRPYDATGARLAKGILFTGKPGVGKTLMARVIAKESGCIFLYANAAELESKWVGGSAENVKTLFDTAKRISNRRHEPVIVFIDEIDAIGSRQNMSHGFEGKMINQLLSCMDGFDQNANIIVIGATNYPKCLDPAAKRSGRFDMEIEIQVPNERARNEIFSFYAKKHPLHAAVDEAFFAGIAQKTEGFVGADLANFVNQAAINAGSRNARVLMREDFEQPYYALVKKKRAEEALHQEYHMNMGLGRQAAGIVSQEAGSAIGSLTMREQADFFRTPGDEYHQPIALDQLPVYRRGFNWGSFLEPVACVGFGLLAGHMLDCSERHEYRMSTFGGEPSIFWLGGHRWKVLGTLGGAFAHYWRQKGII